MNPLSPVARLVIFVGAWVVWFSALVVLRNQRREKAVRVDAKGRWGIALQMAGYVVACTHGPDLWGSDLEVWRAVTGIVIALLSIPLFRSAVAHLGKQWRFDAGLNRDHELVKAGAYRIVRHPIYASMFGMLLADICWAGTLPGWPIAVLLFVAGTEIRVRVEDGLLRERFGAKFVDWQKARPAYVPFVR
jgi:protein-S-isoprenylcysteine O-methyltransferase Ste14